MKRLLPLLFALALLLGLVAIVAAAPDAPVDPDDCPVGQYLCLTPGHGGYIYCDGGTIDYHPVPDNPELAIVYCESPFAGQRDAVKVFVPIVP